MICLVGLHATELGLIMFAAGWQFKATPEGAQMVTLGLQIMLHGMLALA